MKANELRIGNWVEFMGKEVSIDMEQLRDTYFNNACSLPIPLTEEWLVKFGFECKDSVNGGYLIKINYDHQKEYLYCSKEGTVALWSEIENRDFIIMNSCKHVHTLQNLYFALTGEELTHE